MDSEALKIILELKEENTLYKKAISEILLILVNKHYFDIPEYGLNDDALHLVFRKLKNLYGHDKEPVNKCHNTKVHKFRRKLILALIKNPNSYPESIDSYMSIIGETLRLMECPKAEMRQNPKTSEPSQQE